MKIAAICAVYNEAKILPYFLSHYGYCDEIRVLYETDSDDGTRELLMQNEKVILREHHVEGGLDDIQIAARMNAEANSIDADWVYVLSPDELILPATHEDPRQFFERQKDCNHVFAAMYNVYRHHSEADLNPILPPLPQRTHGDPDLSSTVTTPNRDSNAHFIKPCIIRPNSGIALLPGYHEAEGDLRRSREVFVGAHWQMADADIAVTRRMQNRNRMSEVNRRGMMGFQHFNVTEDWIRKECLQHQNDPQIAELLP